MTPRAFCAGPADDAQAGDAAAAGAEDVPDVVVGAADDRVQVGLVLAEHGDAVAVGVRVGAWVGVDDQVVVGDQHHAHGHLSLVDAVHPVHRRHDRGQSQRHRAAVEGGVLAGGGHGQAIGAELRASRWQDALLD